MNNASFNREPIGVTATFVSESQRVRPRLTVKRGCLPPERLPLADAFGLVGARRSPPSEWLIGAAFVPLMFLAGIMILVETKKGRLVIESEVAGVNVTLMRDGEVYDELKIEPGTNSTTLFAGQYKIVVDGAQDVSLLEGGKIEIKRGEVVVARIRPEAKPTTEMVAGKVERTYDDKTVDEWLDIVAREQSSAKVRAALVAVKSLLSPEKVSVVTERLLQLMPTFSSDLAQSRVAIEVANTQSNSTQSNRDVSTRYSSPLDELAFSILRSANSRCDFTKLLVRELDTGDIGWQRRILLNASSLVAIDAIQELEAALRRQFPNSSLTIIPNQKGCTVSGFVASDQDVEHILSLTAQYYQPVVNLMTVADERSFPSAPSVQEEFPKVAVISDFLPITEWIEKKVIDAGRDDELLQICADFYWDLINHSLTDEATKLSLLGRLASCKALGPAFWLEPKRIFDFAQPTQFRAPQSVLFSPAKVEIEKQAIATLATPDGKSPFRVQAAIVLRLLYAQTLNRFAADDTRKVVVDLVKSLLRRMGNSQDELLAVSAIPDSLLRSTALVNEINTQARLDILKPSGESRSPYISWTIGRFSPAQSFFAVELLELIRTMEASSECSPELLKLYMATAEQNEQLNAILDAHPVSDATWPGMATKPASPVTTDQWIAGIVRIRAFQLLAPETQAELTQLANRTFQSRTSEQPVAQPAMPKAQEIAGIDAYLEWSKKQIAKYDKNKDGQLTVDEWSSMLIRPDGADANGDGAITAEELAALRKKQHKS